MAVTQEDRSLLREFAFRFPFATSDTAQAMRELADVYETPIFKSGLPQEDEVVSALMQTLASLKVRL
jgi:hypothetical protein